MIESKKNHETLSMYHFVDELKDTHNQEQQSKTTTMLSYVVNTQEQQKLF